LAKPQDGSSILKLSSARCIRTSGFSFMRVPFHWAVESLGLCEQGWCLRGHGHRQADWPKWQPTRLRRSPPPQRRSCIFLQAQPAGSRNCQLSHFRWSRSEPEAGGSGCKLVEHAVLASAADNVKALKGFPEMLVAFCRTARNGRPDCEESGWSFGRHATPSGMAAWPECFSCALIRAGMSLATADRDRPVEQSLGASTFAEASTSCSTVHV